MPPKEELTHRRLEVFHMVQENRNLLQLEQMLQLNYGIVMEAMDKHI